MFNVQNVIIKKKQTKQGLQLLGYDTKVSYPSKVFMESNLKFFW
ncbi:hypothetical protein HNQ41_000228 [Texcoconibacillus texcoconensis]|uniref:Uncharacterized protein n=1 Tax=Texcoconibacillus texcoconensis TaxID=1095777 RepID=A0A840QL49_9BACI|nr:hypothetical protein [Texcoconibacillus texcoconensis]